MNEILVVEDDRDLAALLQIHLTRNHYKPYLCKSGKEINDLELVKKYDLILLDLFLPDMSGISLCEKIREISYIPIIFMSCMGDSDYKIQALYAGGDDYLVKPLDYKELLARISIHIRRNNIYSTGDSQDTRRVNIKDLVIDYDASQIYRDGELLNLSPLEFEILSHLVTHKNKLVDYDSLYRSVWNCESHGDVRTVMVHVSNLRKKIETPSLSYIKTVRNKGYIFCENFDY